MLGPRAASSHTRSQGRHPLRGPNHVRSHALLPHFSLSPLAPLPRSASSLRFLAPPSAPLVSVGLHTTLSPLAPPNPAVVTVGSQGSQLTAFVAQRQLVAAETGHNASRGNGTGSGIYTFLDLSASGFLHKYTAQQLNASTPYCFRVAAVNTIGRGTWSSIVCATTDTATVPDMPSDLELTVVAAATPTVNGTATVQFRPPVSSGGVPITQYQCEAMTCHLKSGGVGPCTWAPVPSKVVFPSAAAAAASSSARETSTSPSSSAASAASPSSTSSAASSTSSTSSSLALVTIGGGGGVTGGDITRDIGSIKQAACEIPFTTSDLVFSVRVRASNRKGTGNWTQVSVLQVVATH